MLAQTPNLHYLTPIKRNDKRIEKYDVLKFTEIVPEIERHVVGNKVILRDNTFLYAFKDIELASSENSAYLARTVKDKEFDADKHEKITNKFGVIIFESDVDLSIKDTYLTYESRWLLEAMFKQYKSNEALKETRVQEDFTVIGYEFVNFISTLITSRIINHSRACGVLNSMTYGEFIEALNSVWRESDIKYQVLMYKKSYIKMYNYSDDFM